MQGTWVAIQQHISREWSIYQTKRRWIRRVKWWLLVASLGHVWSLKLQKDWTYLTFFPSRALSYYARPWFLRLDFTFSTCFPFPLSSIHCCLPQETARPKIISFAHYCEVTASVWGSICCDQGDAVGYRILFVMEKPEIIVGFGGDVVIWTKGVCVVVVWKSDSPVGWLRVSSERRKLVDEGWRRKKVTFGGRWKRLWLSLWWRKGRGCLWWWRRQGIEGKSRRLGFWVERICGAMMMMGVASKRWRWRWDGGERSLDGGGEEKWMKCERIKVFVVAW